MVGKVCVPSGTFDIDSADCGALNWMPGTEWFTEKRVSFLEPIDGVRQVSRL